MITTKSVYFIIITIFLVSFYGKCLADQSETIQFIKNAQDKGEDYEYDLIEPKLLYTNRPKDVDDLESNQEFEDKKLYFTDGEKEMKENNEKQDEEMGKKRIVRQVNSAYSHIYPTLTPPYRPAAGANYGNVPNNYPSNQNSYSNQGGSQPYYPQGQNSFQNNTRFANPGHYNQGSTFNNNNQLSTNIPYPQYNQNSNQHYNSSIGQPKQYFNNYPSVNNSNPSFRGSQYGNTNQHTFTPTPTNQWTRGYTNNNTRYNPSAPNGASPNYPNFNSPPNSYHNFNNSTLRTVINGQNNPTNTYPQHNLNQPSNQPYQSYPHSTNTQHNNYNGSNQWSSSPNIQPNNYNTRNSYPVPGGLSSNVSNQNYPGYNPSSYPTNNNPYNQQPYSHNPYSQNSNSNQNQYKLQ